MTATSCALAYRFPPKMQQATLVRLRVLCFLALQGKYSNHPDKSESCRNAT
ncbi:unnamed protein product, partial [Brassica oleracea var. botrytis]